MYRRWFGRGFAVILRDRGDGPASNAIPGAIYDTALTSCRAAVPDTGGHRRRAGARGIAAGRRCLRAPFEAAALPGGTFVAELAGVE
jgi:hypothetical protein